LCLCGYYLTRFEVFEATRMSRRRSIISPTDHLLLTTYSKSVKIVPAST
jgi:hypothetical protein